MPFNNTGTNTAANDRSDSLSGKLQCLGPSGMGALVGEVNGMVMSRMIGNEQGGVTGGFSSGASFEDNGEAN